MQVTKSRRWRHDEMQEIYDDGFVFVLDERTPDIKELEDSEDESLISRY